MSQNVVSPGECYMWAWEECVLLFLVRYSTNVDYILLVQNTKVNQCNITQWQKKGEKTNMVIQLKHKKALKKINTFKIKTSQQTRNKRKFPQHNK